MADRAKPQHKMITIDEGLLASMSTNAGFVKEFAFLKGLARPTNAGCGRCGKSNQEQAGTFRRAKAAIASLSSERKRRLKELLNAHRIRVTFVNNSQKVIQLTF